MQEFSENKKIMFSNVIFLISISIVILNLVSILFPRLLVISVLGVETEAEKFELGAWSRPLIITNLAILGFWILYYTKKLPNRVVNSIKSIREFETSPLVTMIVIVIALGLYVILTVDELEAEEDFMDFFRIEPVVRDFPFYEGSLVNSSMLYVKNFLLFLSLQIFDNFKIIPFIGSISLLLVTYFFTAKVSQKRFAGVIAMIVLLQSFTFRASDTSAVYTNFWAAFYILSLYLLHNKWMFSPIALFLSIFSKPLPAIFIPITMFFTLTTNIAKRNKIKISIMYLIVIVLVVLAIGLISNEKGAVIPIRSFSFDDFMLGFTHLSYQLRLDGLVMVFLLPLTFVLFWMARKGNFEALSILGLIIGLLFITNILGSLTEYNITPYRFIPFVVVFSTGIGFLFSKKVNQ